MDTNRDQREAERYQIDADILFCANTEVTHAEVVNVSRKGVRFETAEPLSILMRITTREAQETHGARLVWAQRDEDGRMSYGFEFISDAEYETARIRPDEGESDVEALRAEVRHLRTELARLRGGRA